MQNKKLLGSTLALAMILPSASVNAELLKNFKLSGQLDLQGTSAANVTDFAQRQSQSVPAAQATATNDRIGDMQTRLMVSADWDLLDDVHSKVTLTKNDRNWGTVGGNGHGNALSQPIDGSGAGNVMGRLFVDQAYVKIDKVFGSVDTTLGRQFYGNSGDLIIYVGPSDKALYGMPVNALDVARFDWANDMVGLTGIAGKVAGSAVGAVPQSPNTDIRGLVATLKAKDNVSGSLSVYNRVIHNLGASGVNPSNGVINTVGGKNDNLYVADLKGKLTAGGAWVSGEFAKNFGENRNGGNANAVLNADRHYDGWAFKLDGGYKADLSGLGAATGWGSFGYGSGDGDANSTANNGFVSIAGDYRPGSIYGRFANAQGAPNTFAAGLPAPNGGNAFASNGSLTNRVIWGLGAKITPSALTKFTGGVAYWDYRSQTAMQPNATNGLGSSYSRAYGGNKHIGSEIDVDVEWKHSENVSFNAGVGEFLPGGAIKEAVQATSATSNTGGAVNGFGSQNNDIGNNPAKLAYFDVRVKF